MMAYIEQLCALLCIIAAVSASHLDFADDIVQSRATTQIPFTSDSSKTMGLGITFLEGLIGDNSSADTKASQDNYPLIKNGTVNKTAQEYHRAITQVHTKALPDSYPLIKNGTINQTAQENHRAITQVHTKALPDSYPLIKNGTINQTAQENHRAITQVHTKALPDSYPLIKNGTINQTAQENHRAITQVHTKALPDSYPLIKNGTINQTAQEYHRAITQVHTKALPDSYPLIKNGTINQTAQENHRAITQVHTKALPDSYSLIKNGTVNQTTPENHRAITQAHTKALPDSYPLIKNGTVYQTTPENHRAITQVHTKAISDSYQLIRKGTVNQTTPENHRAITQEHTKAISDRYPLIRKGTVSQTAQENHRAITQGYTRAPRITEHSMLSKKKTYICFLVRNSTQPEAPLEKLECATRINSGMTHKQYIAFCGISTEKWRLAMLSPMKCSAISTSMLKELDELIRKGTHLIAWENGVKVAVAFICVHVPKNFGEWRKSYICLVKTSLVQEGDRSWLLNYLVTVCKYPAWELEGATITVVNAAEKCVTKDTSAQQVTENKWQSNILLFACVLVVCLIGTVLNSIAIAILAKGGMDKTDKSKPSFSFITLLSMDILHLLATAVKALVMLDIVGLLPAGICHVTYFGNLYGFIASTNVLLAITVERYVAVCHPLWTSRLLSYNKQKWVIPIKIYRPASRLLFCMACLLHIYSRCMRENQD